MIIPILLANICLRPRPDFRKYIKALGDYRLAVNVYNQKNPNDPYTLDTDLIRVPTPNSTFIRGKGITPPHEAKGLPLLQKVGQVIDTSQLIDQKDLAPETVIALCAQRSLSILPGFIYHPNY